MSSKGKQAEIDYVVGVIRNKQNAGEGSLLPPIQKGSPFRVPFVSGVSVLQTTTFLGGTTFILGFQEPQDPQRTIDHYNVYYATFPSTQLSGPVVTSHAPVSVNILTPNASQVTFYIQTVLKNGLSSDIKSSPTATGTTVAAATGTFPASPHNILSNTHADTLTDNVVAGDIIVGNATPKWSRLAANATGTVKYLQSVSGVTQYAQVAYSDLSGTPSIPTPANPTALVGLAAVNGTAATYLRSDGAPALDQSIAPTWTGAHLFKPASDSVTELQVQTHGGSPVFDVDTTNTRVGVGTNAPAYPLDVRGDIAANVAGNGFRVKEGSNAKMGTAVLTAGAATVSTTAVTANSRIFLTSQVDGGTPGFVRVDTRTPSTSFHIQSSNASDTSTIAWLIVEPA